MLESTVELLFSTTEVDRHTTDNERLAVKKILDSLDLNYKRELSALPSIQSSHEKFHVMHVFAKVCEQLRAKLNLDTYDPGKNFNNDSIALTYAIVSMYAANFMESCFKEVVSFFTDRLTDKPSFARAYLKRKDKHDFASHACGLIADARENPTSRTFFLERSRYHANKSIVLHEYNHGRGCAFAQLYLRRAQANYGLAWVRDPQNWKFQAVADDVFLALEKPIQPGAKSWRTSRFLSRGAYFLANIALCFDPKAQIPYTATNGVQSHVSLREVLYQDAMDYLAEARVALQRELTLSTSQGTQNALKLLNYRLPDFNSCIDTSRLPVRF